MNSVLVTGGTGTFGRAYVKRLLAARTPRICIYSRDEYKQAMMREELQDHAALRWFIGDVRDQGRLTRACEGVGLVIHAAALKRVEVGEYNPAETVKTNVQGTLNVIEAAQDANVGRVILISSDKAASPMNAYGASKLLAERVMIAANNTVRKDGTRFSCVRLGNFAGSRGSVFQTWKAFKASGTVPVTDTRCTRYVMLEAEAVALVERLAVEMKGGELIIPEMKAFRVVDLARAFGCVHSVIGLRPGERLHEELRAGETSETAPKMTVLELKELLAAL